MSEEQRLRNLGIPPSLSDEEEFAPLCQKAAETERLLEQAQKEWRLAHGLSSDDPP